MEKVSNGRIDGNIRSFVIRPKRTKRRAEAKRWEGAVGNLRICGKAVIPFRFSQGTRWGSCSVASRTSTAFAARQYLARQSGMPRRQCIDPLCVERTTLSHRPESTTYKGSMFELGNQSIGRDVMLHMNGTFGARQSALVPPFPIADAGLDHSHLRSLAFDGSCLPMPSMHFRTIASTAPLSQSRIRFVASLPFPHGVHNPFTTEGIDRDGHSSVGIAHPHSSTSRTMAMADAETRLAALGEVVRREAKKKLEEALDTVGGTKRHETHAQEGRQADGDTAPNSWTIGMRRAEIREESARHGKKHQFFLVPCGQHRHAERPRCGWPVPP